MTGNGSLGIKLPRYHWSHSDTTHSSPLRDIILLSGSLYKIASLEAINSSLIGILASCKGKWFFETVVIEPIFQHSRWRHFQILSLCNLQPFEKFFVVFVAFYNVNTVRWEILHHSCQKTPSKSLKFWKTFPAFVMCKTQYSHFLRTDSPINVFPFVLTKNAKTFGGIFFS